MQQICCSRSILFAGKKTDEKVLLKTYTNKKIKKLKEFFYFSIQCQEVFFQRLKLLQGYCLQNDEL